ncbi:hypothetical protein J0S82_000492, partial [Galemys pyrenaicus]
MKHMIPKVECAVLLQVTHTFYPVYYVLQEVEVSGEHLAMLSLDIYSSLAVAPNMLLSEEATDLT